VLDWLIIGGGLHGTYLSLLLTQRLAVPRKRLRVLDPHDQPLAVWQHFTQNCGMAYLRSPATHNIDLGIMSLHRFVRASGGPESHDFVDPYYRPRLELFNAHCRDVIARYGLDDLRVHGRALTARPGTTGIEVETATDSITTRRLLLAVGVSDAPSWPPWAVSLHQAGAPVAHIFDLAFNRQTLTGDFRIAIIGGGISAAQTALAVSRQVDHPVTLVTRHPLNQSTYDFDPCWIGPKCLNGFYQTPYHQRRGVVDAARRPGTVPPDVWAALHEAINQHRVRVEVGDVGQATCKSGEIRLYLDSAPLPVDCVLLATGFETGRPGGTFVDRLIRNFQLPCTPNGYPVIQPDLSWRRGIYVTGSLAELQVGPCARNIIGIRNAGRLLAEGLGFSRNRDS